MGLIILTYVLQVPSDDRGKLDHSLEICDKKSNCVFQWSTECFVALYLLYWRGDRGFFR